MNDYTIYCTEQQTKKAIELGAPIYTTPYFRVLKYEVRNFFVKDDTCYYFPTAEQMLGWLEEQINVREICIQRYGNWWYQIYIDPHCHLEKNGFTSRKEATLAAIDAALVYLINQK